MSRVAGSNKEPLGHVRWKNSYLSRFQGGPRRLQKYGRRYTLVRFGFFSEMPRTSKSVAGAILEGHLWSYFSTPVFNVFLKSVELHDAPKTLPTRVQIWLSTDFYGAFWDPSGHLWETFGELV